MKTILLRSLAGLLPGAACAGAAAQDHMSMYGVLDVGIVHASDQNGRARTYMRSGNMLPSRLGFKGQEDLGGGTSALYVLEAGMNIDDGTAPQAGSFFNRQSIVGLSNVRLGTVTVGRQYTPYYLFVGLLVRAGNPTGSADAHPGDIDSLDASNRINNSISYTSPEWHGMQLGVIAGAGEQARHRSDGNAYSAALKIDAGPWSAALGYQMLRNGPDRAGWDPTAAATLSKSALNTGYLSAGTVRYLAGALSYTAGRVILGGVASSIQYRPDAKSRFADIATFDTAGVSASWRTASPWLLVAGYSDTRARAANDIARPARHRQLVLEHIYALSRRTKFYLLQARQVARGDTLGADGVPVPAVAVVGDSQVATPSSNGQQNVFMAGLRHDF
jgi:predicted porin